MQKGFQFDLNKCTGCNACQIACSIENEVDLPLNWRQVNTYNEPRHPEIPYFHLSTACHHCLDPACMKYCPALAIYKDQISGAVIIDEDKCIGCKYCSWVCPYDAPTFNSSKKTMEKCTFCLHRLEEDLLPACVSLCPTSALELYDYQDDIPIESIPGFTKSEIKPAVKFVPLRKNHILPQISDLPFDETTVNLFRESLGRVQLKEKITSLQELPLVIFSLLIAYITGSLTADTLLKPDNHNHLPIILGFIGLGISSLHLGKILRAPRTILNPRHSWLSREITFFTIFIFLLTCQFILFPQLKWLAWIGVIMGFFTLYSLDRVYTAVATIQKQQYHSANALLSGLFFASLFSEFKFGIIVFGGIKFILYIGQCSGRFKHLNNLTILFGSIRVLFGFFIPIMFWLWNSSGTFIYIIIIILIAEFIDRCEFYDSLKTITPRKQMVMDLEKLIQKV